MTAAKTTTRLYCNTLAIEKGFDPVGHAGAFDDLVVFEVPLPWRNTIYENAGALPQEILDLFARWLERYRAGEGYPHLALFIASDADYSQEGYRRVMFYSHQTGMFAEYHKTEYLVPQAELGSLVWSLYEARENLREFEQYRDADSDSTRDILVCTHGTVDAACAKFGYPLYNHLRKKHANEHLRVWRVSHFGGHIFAPTMLDMPMGHYWAYVEEEQAEKIVQRRDDVRGLYGHYRGWAGFEGGFLQAAEREIWMRCGWEWFSYRKSGHILKKDDDNDSPAWAEVQIECCSRDNMIQAAYSLRVEVRTHISTPHSSESEALYPYPQYVVTKIEEVTGISPPVKAAY